jgi:hypothetical protein
MTMMKTNRFYILVTVFSLSVLACSLSGGGNGDQPEAPTNVSPTEQAEVQSEPFISAPGVASVKLLTDVTGVGTKPLLKWESVTSANRYQLIVFDETGESYWAWEGAETQIYMGGTDTQPPDDSSGPSISAGYSWSVVAYGADGKVIAASELRSISP